MFPSLRWDYAGAFLSSKFHTHVKVEIMPSPKSLRHQQLEG